MALSAVKKEPAKPKPGEPAPAAAAEGAAKAPSGKKGKKFILIGVAVAVLGGAGGGAWWYLHRNADHSAPRAEPEKPPVFAALDPFTVNLQQEDGSQFAQIGLTLRMSDEAAVVQLKLRMPEVRDRILLMLSAKKGAELLTLEGKRKLAEEIQAAVNEIVAPEATKKAAAAAAVAAAAAAKSAAAAKQKPAPAPAEPAEGQEAAPQEPATDAAEAAAEPASAPVALPVTGVLFTSFIIQ